MGLRQRMFRFSMRAGSAATIGLFKIGGSRLGAKMHPGGAPDVFLMTTTGARTGKRRTVALSHIEDDDGDIVVGSNGGLPTPPAWVANLRAHPDAVIQSGKQKKLVRARFVEGDEADALRKRISTEWPESYGKVFEAAVRDVPIIRLEERR